MGPVEDVSSLAKYWATAPVPRARVEEEVEAIYAAMPIGDLAALWCEVQRLGPTRHTAGTSAAAQYFDHLPHDAPERALEVALWVLDHEGDLRTRMFLAERFVSALVYNHAARLIDRLESEAARRPRLRWLLGGVHWWAPSKALRMRLARLADEAAWRRDEVARDRPALTLDFAALAPADLAVAWIAQYERPEKDRDANWHALVEFERDLVERDRERALDLVLAVLARDPDPRLLPYLATGLVEDTIGPDTIERIEREAAANPAFRALLTGVWCAHARDGLRARLDAVTGRVRR